MKRALHFLLLFAVALPIASADDFKLTNGNEYKNVTVSRVEPDGLMVITASGIVKLFFVELPKDVQEKYHYDPKAAEQFRAQLDAAGDAAESARAAEAERQHQELLRHDAAVKSITPVPQPAFDNPLSHGATQEWAINGTVLSVTEDGALILCSNSGFGMKMPKNGEVVFLKGALDLVDDDVVQAVGSPIGTYQYTAASNAAKTVRSFAVITLRKVNP
ncbi:MAG: hypothetical protein M3R59_11690 [Verrucomicrobiota bacterium]|nr:hypothetical protein [Verrucomicrobiota bacterium]